MTTPARIEPSAEMLTAARRWLEPVRTALGGDFLAAYVTGSALLHGFDPQHSRVNLLVVSRGLAPEVLDRLAAAIPDSKRAPHFDPLFMTLAQMRASTDVFPIEWLDFKERHLRLEGEDVFAEIEVARTHLRLQCEHELRGKHLRLRHEYLASARRPERLREVLARMASGFHALFRTLLRLRGEEPPASTERVIERVADLFQLDARALLEVHRMRFATQKQDGAEARASYLRFLVEIEKLVGRIDALETS